MFERFTDRARRVVVLAQEEARLLDHNYIGTEHILLGIVHEGEGVGAKALEVMRISLEAVRHQVEEIIGRGSSAPSGHIPFTPRAKKVLELSLREALQLGHNYIGTEHILMGLLREGEGVGAQVLVKLGADLSQVRTVVVQLLSGTEPDIELRLPNPWIQRGFSIAAQAPVTPTCAFCGRDLLEVDRYVAGIGAVICDACVAAATQAVATGSSREVSLPPRVFGDQPATTADTAAIERAFSTVFGTSETPDRPALLEDGEHIFEFLGTVQSQLPQVQVQRVVVSGIRLTRADAAEVRFSIHIGPGMDGISRLGRAIRSGGTWQVSRETFAELVAMGGIRLPPRGTTRSPEEPPPPTP